MSFNFNDLYGSKYLSAQDIEKPTIVTVAAIEVVRFDRAGEAGKQARAALHFKNLSKPFIVNKTNATMLGNLFGTNPNQWVGESFELRPEKTLYGGKMVPALRIHAMQQRRQTKPEPVYEPGSDLNDDLPDELK